MRSVRTFLVVFFCVFIMSLQGSYAQEVKSTSSAQVSEERWNYTMLDVADLQGANRFRISSASVVEVTRSRLQTGELKYNYAIKEAAGQVAGQEQPLVFTATKSWSFYKDLTTRKLRTDAEELTSLFDLMNSVVERLPKDRKRIGDRWQQIINIGKGSEFLPGKVAVNFEIQDLSQTGYGKLLLIRYSSEELTFQTMDAEGGQVKAEFSGFTTYDPGKDLIIHMVWDFRGVRSRLDGKADLFKHNITYFMSDPKGETPVVPFGIYPEIAKAAAESRVRLTRILSDPKPPEWFWQTLSLSKMSWSFTGIAAEESVNPIGLAIIAGLNILESVVETATDLQNDGQFNGNGFSAIKWGLEKAGVDPQYSEIAKDVIKLAMPGPRAIATALGASTKLVQIASFVGDLNKLITAINLINTLAQKTTMIPPAVQTPPQQISFSVQNALQDFKQLAKPFQPLTEPFVPLFKPTLDASQLAQRTAQQQLTPVNVTFTQTYSGIMSQTIGRYGSRTTPFEGSFTGTRVTGDLPGNANFTGTFTGTNVYNSPVYANPLYRNISFNSTMTGEAKGFRGNELKGTVNCTIVDGLVPTGNTFTYTGNATIKPDGSLSAPSLTGLNYQHRGITGITPGFVGTSTISHSQNPTP